MSDCDDKPHFEYSEIVAFKIFVYSFYSRSMDSSFKIREKRVLSIRYFVS